jgi:hypothetical protein
MCDYSGLTRVIAVAPPKTTHNTRMYLPGRAWMVALAAKVVQTCQFVMSLSVVVRSFDNSNYYLLLSINFININQSINQSITHCAQ